MEISIVVHADFYLKLKTCECQIKIETSPLELFLLKNSNTCVWGSKVYVNGKEMLTPETVQQLTNFFDICKMTYYHSSELELSTR